LVVAANGLAQVWKVKQSQRIRGLEQEYGGTAMACDINKIILTNVHGELSLLTCTEESLNSTKEKRKVVIKKKTKGFFVYVLLQMTFSFEIM